MNETASTFRPTDQQPEPRGPARGVKRAPRTMLPPLTRAERGKQLPLSFAQQRLWFLAQMKGASEAYHVPFGMCLRGKLHRLALRQALDRIVGRHEALRTTFVLLDDEPVQRIVPVEDSRFDLVEHDLQQHVDVQGELDRLTAEEVRTPFDLQKGPLIRGRLIRHSEDEHTLLITMHHIVSDKWSLGVFNHELSVLYNAFARDERDPLPELNLQYVDYAIWQRKWMEGDILRQQAEYWKATLAGAAALLELPGDHVRPDHQDYAGALIRLALDAKLTAGLKELGLRHGTTLYMTLLAGWAALVGRLSGQPEVVIGTPVANRRRVALENLIGFFVNTLALRVDVSDSPTVAQLLARVKVQAMAAQGHQDIPFEQVVETIRPVRSLSHSPLFQVMFAWQNAPERALELVGLKVEPLRSAAPHVVAQFDLTLHLWVSGGGIAGVIEYSTALFERTTVERYMGYLRRLLEGMVADDSAVVDRLPMLGDEERERVLYEWNRTEAEFRADKCVHELFEEHVRNAPDAVAVVYEDGSATYRELNARSNQLAHYLRGLGVKPDQRVAMCVERGFEMIAGLLGVLKAGAAYVPLDPGYPQERLQHMMQDSGAVALLTQGHLKALFAGVSPGAVIDMEASAAAWRQQPEGNPDAASVGLTCQHLAYVIFTSGSTGVPKGVEITHSAVLNFLESMRKELGFVPASRLLALTPLSFDIAVLEIFLPLTTRGQVIIANREVARDPTRLAKRIGETKPHVIQATPATWRTLIEAGWTGDPRLSIVCGGEAMSRELAQQLLSRSSAIWNMYGPTETTIWSVIARVESGSGLVPIGKPIANTRVYILDVRQEPVPVGVVGELYIGGAGVARGYLHRPGQTAERFLPDPFANKEDARMYRTGDLGRWLANGDIEFLGRNDFQVKIRGYRIELGEIEARLAEHEGVREAVVVAREDTSGDKRLLAYYTSRDANGAESAIGAEVLRRHLAGNLPEYMLPAAYVRMERLPLTPNGKLDRKALPSAEADAYSVPAYEAPEGEIETILAGIWAGVLRVERVGRQDNFFELGGHSLLAARAVYRIRGVFSTDVSLVTFFLRPTVAGLAAAIRELPKTESCIDPIQTVSRHAELPLSFNQQGRLLFEWSESAGSGLRTPFPLVLTLSIDGHLNLDTLEQAVNAIVQRHEIFRTTFSNPEKLNISHMPAEASALLLRMNRGERVTAHEIRGLADALLAAPGLFEQRIHSTIRVTIPLMELETCSSEEQSAAISTVLAEELRRHFDYEQLPLLRLRLLRTKPTEHVLIVVMSHLLGDKWSLDLFRRELELLYASFANGAYDIPDKPTLQSVDFSAWQREQVRSGAFDGMIAYWKVRWTEFSLFDIRDLPFSAPISASTSLQVESECVEAGVTLLGRLRPFLRERQLTLHMFFLAVLNIVLHLHTNKPRVGLWGLFANRTQEGTEELLAWLANAHILGTDLSGNPRITDVLERVRTGVLDAQAYQAVPMLLFQNFYMKELQENQGKRSPVQPHITFTVDAYEPPTRMSPRALSIQPIDITSKRDTYSEEAGAALRIVVKDQKEKIAITAKYAREAFEQGSVSRLLMEMLDVAGHMIATPHIPLSNLNCMRHGMRQKGHNAENTDYKSVAGERA